MILFFAIVLTLWAGLHAYIHARVAAALDLGRAGRVGLAVAFALLGSLYLAARVLERRAPRAVVRALDAPGAVWLGVFSVLLSCVAGADLLVALPTAVISAAATGALDPATAAAAAAGAQLVALAGAAALSLYGVAAAARGARPVRFEVPLPGLPPALDGFRLVQLSDVHVGGLVTPGYLRRLLRTVAAEVPDLVVVTGDVTDLPDGGDGAGLRALAGAAGRHGVLACTGNHEAYHGGERTVAAIAAAGIPVLRQAHRVVAGGLVVAGVDDPTFLGGRARLPEAIDAALAGRPAGLPVVLLCHQPSAVAHAAAAGVDLMLSGHTHGGQVPPFQLLTRLAYRYLRGRHRIGRMLLHVSKGAGFWGPPLRVFAPADFASIALRAHCGRTAGALRAHCGRTAGALRAHCGHADGTLTAR
jgi:hypothetical protein